MLLLGTFVRHHHHPPPNDLQNDDISEESLLRCKGMPSCIYRAFSSVHLESASAPKNHLSILFSVHNHSHCSTIINIDYINHINSNV